MKKKMIFISLFVGVAAAGIVLFTGPNRANLDRVSVKQLQSHCNALPAGSLEPAAPDVVKCREVGREIAAYMRHGNIDCDLESDDVYFAIRRTLVTAPDSRLEDEAALYIIEQWLKEGTRCRRVETDS
ncbi:MAG: hypothetical protein NXI16_06130 [Alphaproteobacteria bacterium]|nr:hypothetical protein [Alphaproteobacteria bacterium]